MQRLLCQYGLHPGMVTEREFPRRPLLKHTTPNGVYFVPADADRDCIAIAIRRGEIFEPEVVEVARRYAKLGTTVLDVGANFGQMTIQFSRMVGAEGSVLAVEADDYIFSILRRNLEANGCTNVRPVFAAAMEESGTQVFYPEPNFERFRSYGSYGVDPCAGGGRSVRTLAIDDIEFDRPISFMKVDIQGSDLLAMRGARKTIERHRMPILFEYEEQFQREFSTSFQDYMDFVTSIGYRVQETVLAINYLIVPR